MEALLSAGAAKVRINPDNGDEAVSVRCAVLKDGTSGRMAVFLNFECLELPDADRLRKKVGEAFNILEGCCHLSVTQNHRFPAGDLEGALLPAALDCAEKAAAALMPCRIGCAVGSSDINVWMGRNTPAGYADMPDFARPVSKELSLVRLDGADGRPVAVLTDYDVQSSVLPETAGVSGDLAGAVMRFVEKRLGCVCLYASQASKEVRPLVEPRFSFPVFQPGGGVRLEQAGISLEGARMLCGYLSSVQGLDILELYQRAGGLSRLCPPGLAGKGRGTRFYTLIMGGD